MFVIRETENRRDLGGNKYRVRVQRATVTVLGTLRAREPRRCGATRFNVQSKTAARSRRSTRLT